MPEHTPGPWRITKNTWTESAKYPLFIDGPGFRPAACLGDGRLNKGTTEANARLIAAAPDLLAALRDMLDHEQMGAEWCYCDNTHAQHGTVCTWCFARAAIAKAEGKAP